MKNDKKKRTIILTIIISLTLLTGCGKPDGRYYLNDSYGNMYIEFSGKNIVVSALGMSLSGTYKIKGNQISIKTNVLGYDSETTYSFSKSGNTITFEGRTFVNNSSGGMSPVMVFLILLLVIGGGAAFYFKKRHKEGRVFTPEEREELANKVNSASRTIAKTASVAGLKTAKVVSAGVTVGVAASKTGFNMAKEAVKNYQANKQMRDEQKLKEDQFFTEWEEVVPEVDTWEEKDDNATYQITGQETAAGPGSSNTDASVPAAVDEEDEWEEESPPAVSDYTERHSVAPQKSPEPQSKSNVPTITATSPRKNLCCICGRELGEGATRIAGLPSGEEVYIDRLCHKMLQIIATTDKPEEFQSASKYIRAHINYVDPVLAQSLTQFIGKGETRLHLK